MKVTITIDGRKYIVNIKNAKEIVREIQEQLYV